MAKAKTTAGDLVLIPIQGGKFLPAKVLYRSDHYKNVILLGLYAVTTEKREVPPGMPPRVATTLYTSEEPILKKRWFLVGHHALAADEQGVAKRIVAGNVWDEDRYVGPASDEDRKVLTEMFVLGAALVEKRAASLASSSAGG